MAAPAATATHDQPTIETLFSAEEIARRIDEMATALAARLPQEIEVLALLKGSFMFTADLLRALHKHGITCRVEFVRVASYGDATTSSDTLTVRDDMPDNIAGQTVLLVDDILDTGRTLHWASEALKARGADPLAVCVLLDKPSRRVVEMQADLVGFTIPDRFVVGYGIDYAQRYRDLPYIGALDEISPAPGRVTDRATFISPRKTVAPAVGIPTRRGRRPCRRNGARHGTWRQRRRVAGNLF